MQTKNNKTRLIALYLPQYHPVAENDEWWGKGFTEWTNTAKAKPLFKGHYQPHIPADLGFYDLRLPEAREAQAELAKQYGIEGFCYYHYWFSGRRILERPFNEVLSSGKPDLPFCLCWANETWTGVWHGCPGRILIKQEYPGVDDFKRHFYELLSAFQDDRYMKVNGKPIFLIYKPLDVENIKEMISVWRELALKEGLKGLYLVAIIRGTEKPFMTDLFDAYMRQRMFSGVKKHRKKNIVKWFHAELTERKNKIFKRPTVYNYQDIYDAMVAYEESNETVFPCVVPNWDNTPRSGHNGYVFHNSDPDLFELQLNKAIKVVSGFEDEENIVFIKSWNEWAEGNYLEPDLKFGRRYLEAVRNALCK